MEVSRDILGGNKEKLFLESDVNYTVCTVLKNSRGIDRIRIIQRDKINDEANRIWLPVEELKELLKMEYIQELLKEI